VGAVRAGLGILLAAVLGLACCGRDMPIDLADRGGWVRLPDDPLGPGFNRQRGHRGCRRRFLDRPGGLIGGSRSLRDCDTAQGVRARKHRGFASGVSWVCSRVSC